MHQLNPLKEHVMREDRNEKETEPLKLIPGGFII